MYLLMPSYIYIYVCSLVLFFDANNGSDFTQIYSIKVNNKQA